MHTDNFDFNPGQYYLFSIIYDRITGKIQLFIDGNLVSEYVYSSPYNTGDYISFRSGNSSFTIDDFKVLRSRTNSVNVTLGSALTNDLIYQNPNPSTPAGKIHSICKDSSSNLSLMVNELLNLDYTIPINGSVFNDSLSADIDSSYSNQLSANWTNAVDSNSAIASYEISFGTAAGLTDVLNWQNTTALDFESIPLTLIENQVYFANLRTINGAGLVGDILSSDGLVYLILDSVPVDTTNSITQNNFAQEFFVCFPNPTDDELSLVFSNPFNGELLLYNSTGQLVYSTSLKINKGQVHTIHLRDLPSGTFFLHVKSIETLKDNGKTITIVKN